MKRVLLAGLCAGSIGLAGCASAPLHYYTLVPAAAAGPSGEASGAAFAIDVLPVGVPDSLDRQQLVTRQGAAGLAVLEGERWGSPLSVEMQAALSAQLSRQLGTQDVAGLPSANGRPVYRVKVQLRSFDAWPGDKVRLAADWSVASTAASAERRLCHTAVEERVAGDYAAMVSGQQRLVQSLAGEIADELLRPGTACPSRPAAKLPT